MSETLTDTDPSPTCKRLSIQSLIFGPPGHRSVITMSTINPSNSSGATRISVSFKYPWIFGLSITYLFPSTKLFIAVIQLQYLWWNLLQILINSLWHLCANQILGFFPRLQKHAFLFDFGPSPLRLECFPFISPIYIYNIVWFRHAFVNACARRHFTKTMGNQKDL